MGAGVLNFSIFTVVLLTRARCMSSLGKPANFWNYLADGAIQKAKLHHRDITVVYSKMLVGTQIVHTVEINNIELENKIIKICIAVFGIKMRKDHISLYGHGFKPISKFVQFGMKLGHRQNLQMLEISFRVTGSSFRETG